MSELIDLGGCDGPETVVDRSEFRAKMDELFEKMEAEKNKRPDKLTAAKAIVAQAEQAEADAHRISLGISQTDCIDMVCRIPEHWGERPKMEVWAITWEKPKRTWIQKQLILKQGQDFETVAFLGEVHTRGYIGSPEFGARIRYKGTRAPLSDNNRVGLYFRVVNNCLYISSDVSLIEEKSYTTEGGE